MLYWIDDNKQITDIPKKRSAFYYAGLKKLDNNDIEAMKEYINQLINDKSVSKDGETTFFVPGWSVKSDWVDTPIQIIYEDIWVGDITYSALWLGLLVMQTIIERSEKWYITKTTFEGRNFEQAFYWTKDPII